MPGYVTRAERIAYRATLVVLVGLLAAAWAAVLLCLAIGLGVL